MWYRILADAIVVLHMGIALFILLGLVAVLVGKFRGWSWVRNFWFRAVHIGAILFVVGESWLGITCPLTTWEQTLREKAGETAYRGDFIAHWVHELLFFEFQPWVFTLVYSLFGLAVVLAMVFVPPRIKPAGSAPRDATRGL